MGFSRRRRGGDGKPRYTAYYRDLRGQGGDPRARSRGRPMPMPRGSPPRSASAPVCATIPAGGGRPSSTTLRVTGSRTTAWRLSTRQDYTSVIHRHIMWFFGDDEDARHRVGTRPRVDHRSDIYAVSLLAGSSTARIPSSTRSSRPHSRTASSRPPQPPRVDRSGPAKPRTILTAQQFDAVVRGAARIPMRSSSSRPRSRPGSGGAS